MEEKEAQKGPDWKRVGAEVWGRGLPGSWRWPCTAHLAGTGPVDGPSAARGYSRQHTQSEPLKQNGSARARAAGVQGRDFKCGTSRWGQGPARPCLAGGASPICPSWEQGMQLVLSEEQGWGREEQFTRRKPAGATALNA